MVAHYATRPTVLVVRHGETAWNAARRMQGHQDVGLNEVGRAQAVRLATRLRNVALGGIVTSDLSRAAETAAAVAAVTGVEVVREPALREQHIGAWEGRLWAEVSAAEPDAIARFLSGDPLWRPPGGETRAELSERVWTALLAHARPGLTGPLLVVTHGGVVWALLERIRGRPQPDEPRAVAPNASLTTLVPRGDTWDLHAFGDVAHLEGACGAPAATKGERPSSRRREARGLSNFVTLGVACVALLLLALMLHRRANDSPGTEGLDVTSIAMEAPSVGPPLAVRSRDPAGGDAGVRLRPDTGVLAPDDVEVTDAVASRGTLRVRVVQDGRPVPGALVSYRRVGGGGLRLGHGDVSDVEWYAPLPAGDALRVLTSTATADFDETDVAADGTVQWDVLLGRYRVFASRDEGDGRLIGFANCVVGEAPVDLDVPVEFTARIAGVVVDASGAPLSGVAVSAWLASDERASNSPPRVTTDVDGRFEVLGFGRKPHVVAIDDALRSGFGPVLTAMPLDVPPLFEGTAVVDVADLQRVVLRARRVERTVLELHAPSVGERVVIHHAAEATEPGVWQPGRVLGLGVTGHSPGAPLYVVVPQSVACPWYVAHFDGYETIVEARRPGGVRRLALRRGRGISGRVTGMSPDIELLVSVHGFVVRGDERVEFHSSRALHRLWSLSDAPCDAFDVAVYWDGDRIGPWVRVPAGDRDVTDVELPVQMPR